MTTIDTIYPTGTEAKVCEIIAIRQRMGVAKYGTTVSKNPLTLRQWHVHHLEELLDAAIYTARIIEKMDELGDDFK